MKLTDAYNEVVGNPLNEAKRDYGCVMLYFPVPKDFWDKIQGRVDDEDVSSDKDADGKELNGRQSASETHITLLYGIHENVPDKDVEAIIGQIDGMEVTLSKVSMFENEKFDVLKFDVEGDRLFEYNKKLSELPHTSNFDYHPHLTVLYAKKGTITDEMTKDLSKDETLTVNANKVVYSKADGSNKNYEL